MFGLGRGIGSDVIKEMSPGSSFSSSSSSFTPPPNPSCPSAPYSPPPHSPLLPHPPPYTPIPLPPPLHPLLLFSLMFVVNDVISSLPVPIAFCLASLF